MSLMSLRGSLARNAKRFALPLAAILLMGLPWGTTAALKGGSSSSLSYLAEETTTSATAGTSQTTVSSAAAPDASDSEAHGGQTGLELPSADQVALNPGWGIEQMSVRVWPEYDRRAVLVILNLSLPTEVSDLLKADSGLSDENIAVIAEHYQPGGSPAFYKFVCRHCKRVVLGWDCD